MKTNSKVLIFVTTSALSCIIFTGLVQSNTDTLISENATSLFPGIISYSPQEKIKYVYVGMEKCSSVCHNNKDMGFQYDIVRKSPHSNAFKLLLSAKALRFANKAGIHENPAESRVCLNCHITGGGLDSSFFASTYRKEDGVTCEACHKGAYTPKTFIPKEEDCLKCHNRSVHKIHTFNFQENCAKIVHPRPIPKLKET